MVGSFASEELGQLVQQLEREQATGCIALEQFEGGNRQYGLLQLQNGQITAARYAHLRGHQALEAIAGLLAPNHSFNQGMVLNIAADSAIAPLRKERQATPAMLEGSSRQGTRIAWANRIQTKVSLILVLFTTLILAAFAIFNVLNLRNRSLAELDTLSQNTAQQLSQHLSVPLWDLDAEIVAASLEAEMIDPRVQTILVRDEDQATVFAGRTRDASGAIIASNTIPTDATLFSSSLPVQPPRGDTTIGQVDVWVTPVLTQAELQQAYLFEGLRVLILALVIIVVTILLVRGMLINPITRLTASANAISTGNSEAVIDVSSNDEIGLLAQSIKRMQASLQVAIRRLQQ